MLRAVSCHNRVLAQGGGGCPVFVWGIWLARKKTGSDFQGFPSFVDAAFFWPSSLIGVRCFVFVPLCTPEAGPKGAERDHGRPVPRPGGHRPQHLCLGPHSGNYFDGNLKFTHPQRVGVAWVCWDSKRDLSKNPCGLIAGNKQATHVPNIISFEIPNQ